MNSERIRGGALARVLIGIVLLLLVHWRCACVLDDRFEALPKRPSQSRTFPT